MPRAVLQDSISKSENSSESLPTAFRKGDEPGREIETDAHTPSERSVTSSSQRGSKRKYERILATMPISPRADRRHNTESSSYHR